MNDASGPDQIAILPLVGIADQARARAEIDAIFFAASATQFFPDASIKAAFRQRWLGRHLEQFPDCSFVAIDATGSVVGYLVGALLDPARDPRFADIPYFAVLASHTARFPAHLHINLDARARNLGIGSRLIEAFASHARAHGTAGLHVVTAKASRNRTFYTREGFTLIAELGDPGSEIVMLGRRL